MAIKTQVEYHDPWYIEREDQDGGEILYRIYDCDHEEICATSDDLRKAELIAAAPKMMRVLKYLYEQERGRLSPNAILRIEDIFFGGDA